MAVLQTLRTFCRFQQLPHCKECQSLPRRSHPDSRLRYALRTCLRVPSSENSQCLTWSGCWESNPVYTHPKRAYCRHTPPRSRKLTCLPRSHRACQGVLRGNGPFSPKGSAPRLAGQQKQKQPHHRCGCSKSGMVAIARYCTRHRRMFEERRASLLPQGQCT